jgi:hypothetical protein
VICKRHQGSAHPYAAHVLLSETEATRIKHSFQQPVGCAERREIPANVRTNIATYAPRCAQQGVISIDASTKLVSWSQGTLRRKPRPQRYAFLNYSQSNRAEAGNVRDPWEIPRRFRILDLTPPGDAYDDSASDADEETDFLMPIER